MVQQGQDEWGGALGMFTEKKEPKGEATSGEGNWSSPGPGKTAEGNQLQVQGAQRLEQSRGPEGAVGLGFFVLGVDLA